jgi:3',5'-cyclic AMP phosphodiesterase CpdA
MSRRTALGRLAGCTAVGLGGLAHAAGSRRLRIAHITDLHFGDGQVQIDGTRELLRSVHVHRPDLLLLTGDIVDGDGERGQAMRNWGSFIPLLRSLTDVPHLYALGNHDPGALSPEDCMFRMGMGRNRFCVREAGGWKFIVLHSNGTGYTGRLDETQMGWLKAELDDTDPGTPVCVLSHYPIMCVCALFDGSNEREDGWLVPGGWVHMDAKALKDVFHGSGNVKLCLSGHMHMHDECHYLGSSYICGGAASGAWWGGPYHEFPKAYGIADLTSEGGFEYRWMTY